MVVMDSTALLLLFYPEARPPTDPATGQPLLHCRERLDLLLRTLSKAGVVVAIPTPVLSEILIVAGRDKPRVLNEISTTPSFSILPFDERAAVELSELVDADLRSSRTLSPHETRAKVKFDNQILAIAKVAGVTTIYTDDESLGRKAKANGLSVVKTLDMPLPAASPQPELPFRDHPPS